MTRLESVVRELPAPPILMGHSAGGAFVQLLLDRGYGAAGVAINSAPTEGVLVTPLAQLKSAFPVLKNPANRHKAVGFTYQQWRYVFTNTFDEADARAAYERYHVPASGGIFWNSVLANFIPGPQEIAVHYHNDTRAPLFFISGSEDHLMPPAIQRSNAKHYSSNTITEVKEFPGRSHLMPAQNGGKRSPTMHLRGPSSTPLAGRRSPNRRHKRRPGERLRVRSGVDAQQEE
jgi:pimeloyl-ACP methyl ester carboxylesterase